jgi:hypothetical protein
LAVLGLMSPAARADNAAEAKSTVDRAIKALGGEKNLADAKAFTLEVKGVVKVNDRSIDVSGTWSSSGDRFRWDVQSTDQGRTSQNVIIVNGGKSWIVGNDNKGNPLPDEVAAALLANIRVLRLVQNPTFLREKGVTLSSLGELKIDDRDCVGLKLKHKGRPDVDIFFDKKKALPVKCEMRIKDLKDGPDVSHTFLFKGFKPFGDIKHPTRLKFVRDGNTNLILELSAISPQEKLDETLFAPPGK